MKHLFTIFGTLVVMLIFSASFTSVNAADLSVRLDEPDSPTNDKEFNLGFVASDILGRTVTVRCYKRAPSEVVFTQFDTNKTYAGSGSGFCNVTSGITGADGTYQFYVTSSAGADIETSQQMAVDINTSGPGTPVSYSKSKPNSCEYKITFKTADDSGKTNSVEIYRSETTTIGLDAGSRVGTISVGSNTEKEFVNGIPDCGKTYYYVIRAYDTSGNGSGTIGDSVVKTITKTTTTTTTTTGSGTTQVTGITGGGVAGGGAIAVGESESFVRLEGEEEGIRGEEEDIEREKLEDQEKATPEGVLGAETEKKPFFLFAWFTSLWEWIKSLFQ